MNPQANESIRRVAVFRVQRTGRKFEIGIGAEPPGEFFYRQIPKENTEPRQSWKPVFTDSL